MAVTIDLGKGARDFVFKVEFQLIVLVADTRYQLPEEHVVGSLFVVVGGQLIDAEVDNGFIVLSPLVFELKKPKYSDTTISAGYQQK